MLPNLGQRQRKPFDDVRLKLGLVTVGCLSVASLGACAWKRTSNYPKRFEGAIGIKISMVSAFENDHLCFRNADVPKR